ncbi:hypothetical protein LH464_19230 [Neorhizobium sp. T786]|uniref:PrpF domain-containing protein n=1 Tax=Pseudorhizobium xiangyangii TaxID=2883104 RepID=UPI001CFFB0F8|nr:PrpF domain-containing protein [Neorhizobium xiangyangii]MCB5204604.1 hypothetical protein [Neorhizobium xiangyangii]
MTSPDIRQMDGIGGAHPLTSKVAVTSPSTRGDADVDYLSGRCLSISRSIAMRRPAATS